MKLQKVYIKNFRGIEELFIDFQGKTNLLIGDNGCGKTTILEAVDLCFNSKLEKEDLHNLEFGSNNNAIVCCIFDENIKQDAGEGESFNAIVYKTHIEEGDEKISQDKYLFQVDANISKEDLLIKIDDKEQLIKIQNATKKTPAIKPILAIYYMPAIDLDDPSKSAGDKSMFAKIYENLNNNDELKKILSDYDNKAKAKTKDIFNDEKDGIKNVLKEYFGIENIDYEYNGSDGITPKINIVNRYGDKTSENLSHAGSGIRKIIKFIARTKFDGQQKSIFLIDEPEQNLHPNFQKSLIDFLKKAGVQCIFTSHSPTFVKHCMNNENCEVLICEKVGEEVEINNMKKKITTNYKFLENHTNSQAVANFLAFGEHSTDLFIYIYEILRQKALQKGEGKEDKDKIVSFLKSNGQEENGKKWKDQRDLICHDGNIKDGTKYPTDDDIKQSINEMIDILK